MVNSKEESLHLWLFVPPANEVWGKVIFSQACVIPSIHKGGGVGWLSSMHHRSHDWGVCIQDGVCIQGRFGRTSLHPQPPLDTIRYGQQAGGTHPTGMHSCLFSDHFCRWYDHWVFFIETNNHW